MKLQNFPILAVTIVGLLSVGTTDLWAHGGGFGGGGARFGGGGGVRGFAAVRGPGFAAVRTPGFAGAVVRGPTGTIAAGRFVGRPAFVGGRFNRFGFRRGFNNIVVAGGGYGWPYPYYGYGYNTPVVPDPNAAQNVFPPPVGESAAALGANPCPGLVAGDVVGNVQRVLKYRGFYGGPIDGLSGPTTRAAIRAYDASVGLPPTGMIDARLLISMQLM